MALIEENSNRKEKRQDTDVSSKSDAKKKKVASENWLIKQAGTFVSSLTHVRMVVALLALGFITHAAFIADPSANELNRNRKVPTKKSLRENVNEAVKDFNDNQADTLKITDFSQDNILLQKLDGKKFDSWSKGLEENLGRSIDARFWEDVANGTQNYSKEGEQQVILKVMGVTRDDVIEVKEVYEADSLNNKTSFNHADFKINSADIEKNTQLASSGSTLKLTEFTAV